MSAAVFGNPPPNTPFLAALRRSRRRFRSSLESMGDSRRPARRRHLERCVPVDARLHGHTLNLITISDMRSTFSARKIVVWTPLL